MQAIVFTRYGTPDNLVLQEIEQPTPTDDEVLVRVVAVSINDWDLNLIQGVPYANRLSFGLRKPKQGIPGSDIAGRVVAVGKNVTRFQPGDAVFGDLSGRWGGFAEYVCARENALTSKPPSMTFEEAAAIPQAALLALQGLQEHLRSGQRVLINGAGGGAGTFALQLAKLHDVDVTAVDSAGKLALLRTLGADQVIDYRREDFTRRGQQYDLIFDVKTNRPLGSYARALRPNGTYVTVGGATARLLHLATVGRLLARLSQKHFRLVVLKTNQGLTQLIELFEAGKVKPIIDRHYPLCDTPTAFHYFASGNHQGKIVITVSDDSKS